MFSKNDYQYYFESVSLQEREMVFYLHNLISRMSDENTVKVLKKIADEEVKHYALSTNMFEELISGQVDLRKWQREHCLGLMQMKNIVTHEKFETRCINLSQGGICIDIEANRQIQLGENFDVQIHFLDGRTPLFQTVIVRWTRRILANLYTCGLEFY